jgi:hypothetical protein
MANLLPQVAEDFGVLVDVEISEFEQGWIDSIRFKFERGVLAISINIDDDTLEIDVSADARSDSKAVSSGPCADLISGQVRWVWLLTNHRGFRDGIQLEFTRDGIDTDIQIMAEASRLWLYELNPYRPRGAA